MHLQDEIFREHDIRGVVGESLDEGIAFKIGVAYGIFLKRQNTTSLILSVGRDMKLSSESLSSSLIEGLVSTGVDVYDLGICPTPVQYFSIFHLNLGGGIMVTGSHNPPEFNGFKLSAAKDTIYGREIQKLKGIVIF